MNYQGLCEGTYAGKALTPTGDRCKNLYPETLAGAGNPEAQKVLLNTPGYAPYGSFFPGSGPIQMIYMEPATKQIFVVAGSNLYTVDNFGSSQTSRGPLGTGPYQFTSNGTQVMISCATSQTGYIYTLATNALAQITAPGFMGTVGCVMLDNYFVSLVPVSRKIQISAIQDGTQWDALDWATVSGGAENAVSLAVVHDELWIFCEKHTEVWRDTGNASFPLERITSISIEQGIASPYAVCTTDNTVFWLGRNRDGYCRVFRADGYVPKGVSNRSVEYFFNMYASEQNFGSVRWDVTMFSYQNESGHTFLVITFPSATSDIGLDGSRVTGSINGAQWVYDIGENEWHERMQVGGDGKEAAPHAIYHVFVSGVHVVGGGPSSNNLFRMSETTYTDNGQAIKRIRRAPHITNGLKWIYYNYLRLSAQVGFSTTAGAADDKIYLRVSNDGGMTWTQPYAKSLGHTGEYKKEICWRRLGKAKRRAFEFYTSVMSPICIIAADLGVESEQ